MDSTERDIASSPAPRARKAPPGWVAPGPPGGARDVPLERNEELSWLLGDWRIVQRKDGHRWSLDDFITAWVARTEGEALIAAGTSELRLLDLGSGIGSVALMLGWCFPKAQITGVEAQEVSFRMALKSARANDAEHRFRFVNADLRTVFDDALAPSCRTWPLVTGTPPYFDDPAQTRSRAVQKGPCRFEERGGVADYLQAMEMALAPSGRAVICHASRQRERVLEAVAASGLRPMRLLEVVPKEGRDALVDVIVLASERTPAPAWERLVVRDRDDQWTPAFLAVRLAMGMPPPP